MFDLLTSLRKSPGPLYALALGLGLSIAARFLGPDWKMFFLGAFVGALLVFGAFFIDLLRKPKRRKLKPTMSNADPLRDRGFPVEEARSCSPHQG
jgi:hypothetical protein